MECSESASQLDASQKAVESVLFLRTIFPTHHRGDEAAGDGEGESGGDSRSKSKRSSSSKRKGDNVGVWRATAASNFDSMVSSLSIDDCCQSMTDWCVVLLKS